MFVAGLHAPALQAAPEPAVEITERTVKAHLSAIFEKLSVRDRVQLALAMNNLPVETVVR